MNKHLIFVYGTLRRGDAGAMSLRFPEAKFIADAKVSGSLYDLGAYPGLQLDESNSLVIGEVYEVNDELLNQLDDFEASSHYLRKQVEVSIGEQRSLCWVYVYDPDFYSPGALITSGDWIEYARTKTDWPGVASPDENSELAGTHPQLKPDIKSIKDILRSPSFMREVSILLFGFAAIGGLVSLLVLTLGNSDSETLALGVEILIQSIIYLGLGIMIHRGSMKALWITGVLFALDTLLIFILPSGKGLGPMIVGRGILIYVLSRYVWRQRSE